MTAVVPRRSTDRRVLAWAAWDWGSAAFNAVITTFVFTVYLTSGYFVDPALQEGSAAYVRAQAGLTSGLSLGIAIAGIAVALLAPALGGLADAAGARRRWLAGTTLVVVLAMAAMSLVVGAPEYFVLGVVLVSVGTLVFEIASVNYNAMLPRVAPPAARGRVSALGWAAGYFGGIVLLVLVYTTLIAGGTHLFGVTEEGGLNIRVVALVCAVWMAVFSVPVLLAVPEIPAVAERRPAVLDAYRAVFRLIGALWRDRRTVLGFLVASAVFRDGLTGVFTFGGIVAAQVFGFTSGEVIVFAIAANVVAGVSTLLSGRLDDAWGPKRVIVVALIGLVVAGLAVFLLRDGGPTVFWIAGLALTAFVGPAQSASRSLLSRWTTPETEGELFGLYQTTGRAASFLAPAMFGLFAAVFGATAFGMLGIVVVLLVGLLLLLPLRVGRPA
ncbi:MFS transporter [Amnibacterium endophyticum]|uniref:MFS transporter n=1 Tax=Amnibacterium endophyticum TaxID=2109337 RepID=A0ABW4LCW0_9MICO